MGHPKHAMNGVHSGISCSSALKVRFSQPVRSIFAGISLVSGLAIYGLDAQCGTAMAPRQRFCEASPHRPSLRMHRSRGACDACVPVLGIVGRQAIREQDEGYCAGVAAGSIPTMLPARAVNRMPKEMPSGSPSWSVSTSGTRKVSIIDLNPYSRTGSVA